MNKKQLKKQVEELKDELNEAVAHHNNHARLLAEAREEIAKLQQEKLDHVWAERVLPRAIESLSHANGQYRDRQDALVEEIASLEAERLDLINQVRGLQTANDLIIAENNLLKADNNRLGYLEHQSKQTS
jgi:chromosome segregation ATPase